MNTTPRTDMLLSMRKQNNQISQTQYSNSLKLCYFPIEIGIFTLFNNFFRI